MDSKTVGAPFLIRITDEVLADLRARLARVRWPSPAFVEDWSAGTSVDYLRDLVEYWRDRFDWPAQEARLNAFPQFVARIEDFDVHYVHIRHGRTPLVLTHGWPNTFADMLKLVPLLEADFDLVIPSLPGYGFSTVPVREWAYRDVPRIWDALMREVLGYPRYGAFGYDVGSWVSARLAVSCPEHLFGVQFAAVPGPAPQAATPSEIERNYLTHRQRWEQRHAGYSWIQETRPATLGFGLSDSPAGLAGWIVEKLREWSDCDGDLARRWTFDEICTLLTLYWCTGTITTSFRAYYDLWNYRAPAEEWPEKPVEVPAGFALFPGDSVPKPPRERAERRWRVARWTVLPRGGHFPAVEEPELLATEIREFFRDRR